MTTDSLLRTADAYLDAGDPEDAITEYLRFIYHHRNDSIRVTRTYAKVGAAFRQQGRLVEAEWALRRSLDTAPRGDTALGGRRVQIAVLHMAAESYESAKLELLRVAWFDPDLGWRRTALGYLGVCHLYARQWSEARRAFALRTPGDSTSATPLLAYLAPANRPGHKSAAVARWLSTFVPGAGQAYARDAVDGLNAFAIGAASSFLVVDAMSARRLADVVLVYAPTFLRYYRGNRRNAIREVEAYNATVDKRYAEQALRLYRLTLTP